LAALRKKQVSEKRDDIDAIMQLLVMTIGISRTNAASYAETLVLDHKVDSEVKFKRKVGSDIAGYGAILQLDADDVELLEEYFNHMNIVPPPQSPSTGILSGGASVASTGGGSQSRQQKRWNCFMVNFYFVIFTSFYF